MCFFFFFSSRELRNSLFSKVCSRLFSLPQPLIAIKGFSRESARTLLSMTLLSISIFPGYEPWITVWFTYMWFLWISLFEVRMIHVHIQMNNKYFLQTVKKLRKRDTILHYIIINPRVSIFWNTAQADENQIFVHKIIQERFDGRIEEAEDRGTYSFFLGMTCIL